MSERAGRFLRFAGGELSRDLMKTVHPELQLDLRAALIAAKQERRQAEFRNVRLNIEDEERQLTLIVRPVELPDSAATYFLVVFDDDRGFIHDAGASAVFEAHSADNALGAVVHRLEDELQQTRERLRLTVAHSEVSTEELETSKEELQSVNEELTTVNNELKEKVDEVSHVNTDLQNLMHSTDFGTLFLDRALRIKRYTRRIEEFFNIISTDIGRPFSHLTHGFNYDNLVQDAATVIETLAVVEREIQLKSGPEIFLARFSPYRTEADTIGGVVISFVDVTQLKRATDTLREHEVLLNMAQEAAKAGVWTLNPSTGSAWWSNECFALYGKEPGAFPMTVENWVEKMHPLESD